MQIDKAIQAVYTKARAGKDPRLIYVALEPGKVRCPLPKRYRDWAQVDAELQKTFQELTTGKLPWPLFLHGEAGSGKTCAVQCIVQQFGGWYVTLPDLCRDLRLAMKGELQYSSGYQRMEYDIWQTWETSTLAVLDEIGNRDPSNFEHKTLKRALDLRLEKPAVFVSNYDIKSLDRLYDDPVASRLGEGTVCELTGDRRNRKDVNDE